MSQFRRLFFNKPMDPLVKISDRIYVLDRSFSNNVMREDESKLYLRGVVSELQVKFPDASFMMFNFKEGEERSQTSDFLSQYDMAVMDYPSHYQSCPLLPLKKIHRFLRLCESWLSLEGQQNVVLLHCEKGGWPVLAFMLSGLLLYSKRFHGEKKTLEMIHRYVPKEDFHLFSPLNPKPSQIRYLEYMSRRNLWPSSDTPLLLDCLILRDLPRFEGRKGCRPILRVYGLDPEDRTNRSSILLFSTPKTKKHTRLYQQEECFQVKLDIQCRVQGDVVLECVHLHDDMVSEEMVFRITFHTAFVTANILMVQRDEMDMLWDAKHQFPKEFKAGIHMYQVLFSGADAMVPAITTAPISEDENDFDVISHDEFVEVEVDHRRDSDSYVVVDTSSDDSKATSVLHSSQAAASPPPPPPLPTYSSRSQNDNHSQTSQLPPPPPPPPFASKRPTKGGNVLPPPPLSRPRKFVNGSTPPAARSTSQPSPTSPPPPPLSRPRKFVNGSTPAARSTSQPSPTSPPPPPPPPPPFTYVGRSDIMLPPTLKSVYGSIFETHVACPSSSPSPSPPPPFSSLNTRKANIARMPYNLRKRNAPSPSPKAPPPPPLPPQPIPFGKTSPPSPPPQPIHFGKISPPPPPPQPIHFGKTSPPPPPPQPIHFGKISPPPPPPLFRFGASRPAHPPPMRRPPPPPPPSPPVFGARRAALIQRTQQERLLLYYNHLCLLDLVTNGNRTR